MRVVGGVPLWVVCVFPRVDVVRLCLLSVANLSAVFCVICSSCLMLVVIIWWKRTRVWDLYVSRIVSFCFPHVVDASALRICIVLRAFVVVISMCVCCM